MPSGGHNKRPPAEERVPLELSRCPSGLDPKAARFWKRYAPDLAKRGLLMPSDRASFQVLAETWALIQDCMALLREEGLTVRGVGHTVKKHPATSTLNGLLAQYRQLAAEFGLAPLSRERLGISSNKDKLDEDTEWLLGRPRRRLDHD